ncbi:unnamed protein product, partial [Amoebophrya sp. A25]
GSASSATDNAEGAQQESAASGAAASESSSVPAPSGEGPAESSAPAAPTDGSAPAAADGANDESSTAIVVDSSENAGEQPAADPPAAETEEPDLDYSIASLRGLVTCLNLTQRHILSMTGIDADFLMALPEEMVGEQISEAIRGLGGVSVLRASGGERPLPAPTDDAVVAALPRIP